MSFPIWSFRAINYLGAGYTAYRAYHAEDPADRQALAAAAVGILALEPLGRVSVWSTKTLYHYGQRGIEELKMIFVYRTVIYGTRSDGTSFSQVLRGKEALFSPTMVPSDLGSLSIRGWHQVNDEAIVDFVRRSPNLHTLNLEVKGYTGAFLSKAPDQFHALHLRHLRSPYLSVFECQTRLRSLRIDRRMTQREILDLALPSHLDSLHLTRVPGQVNDLSSLANTRLRTLHLGGATLSTSAARHLKHLPLEKVVCRKVSEEARKLLFEILTLEEIHARNGAKDASWIVKERYDESYLVLLREEKETSRSA